MHKLEKLTCVQAGIEPGVYRLPYRLYTSRRHGAATGSSSMPVRQLPNSSTDRNLNASNYSARKVKEMFTVS